VIRVDGCDFVKSYAAMHDAAQWARERRGPALVHASVTRPYSHSLSDDERLYKTPAERAAEARRDPIARLKALLIAENIAPGGELAAVAREFDEAVKKAPAPAIGAPKPAPDTASLFVYSPDVDPRSSAFATQP